MHASFSSLLAPGRLCVWLFTSRRKILSTKLQYGSGTAGKSAVVLPPHLVNIFHVSILVLLCCVIDLLRSVGSIFWSGFTYKISSGSVYFQHCGSSWVLW